MQNTSQYDDFFYSAQDGLKLHARVYGAETDALPAICLAGLTRNAADFHELALSLSTHPKRPRQVIAFDYRGRGRSAYDPNWRNYDVLVEAADILAGLTVLGIEHGAFIGTSRGGIIVHVLAAMRPGALKAVVLNDIGPVVEGAGLAQIRAYLERAPKPKTFAEAIAIQRAAMGQTFSALAEADWERMIRAFYREENGALVADFDPALIRTVTAVDLNQPLPTLWPQFMGLAKLPLLAIRGENSKLFAAATLDEMASRHPGMEQITVEGQGHAPLLETGDLPKRIAAFLERADPRTSA
ncbi:MAG: alpha/beta hydrolase [Mesorhizobium sp.]|nr:alpha/beta hydrolase [Mesorhizobium sp.]